MLENLIREYKLQIVCKGENVILSAEFRGLDIYSADEIITKMLEEAHEQLCDKDIYAIMLWKIK